MLLHTLKKGLNSRSFSVNMADFIRTHQTSWLDGNWISFRIHSVMRRNMFSIRFCGASLIVEGALE
jgi:hypothetical protein